MFSQLCFQVNWHNRSLSLSCHHRTLYSEAQKTASKFSPPNPMKPSQLLTSSIIAKIRVRGGTGLTTQMADGSKIFGLSLYNYLEFSFKSQLQCWGWSQFCVSLHAGRSKEITFSGFQPSLTSVISDWGLWLLVFTPCFGIGTFSIKGCIWPMQQIHGIPWSPFYKWRRN